MQYTLDQACERLANYQHAYGVTDIRTAINAAVQALAGLNGWECLRRVVRFSSAGPVFALPQGCAGLVRACVNGNPVTMRGQDFRFLQNGPGDDCRRPPVGFDLVPPRNIENIGESPVIFEPCRPFRLFAYSEGSSEPVVTVKALDMTGQIVRFALPVHQYASYDQNGDVASGCEIEDAESFPLTLTRVLEVTLDKCATKYVTLYARDGTGGSMKIAVYHPSVRAPSFRHYRVVGYPMDRPVEILAEVRIDPLPLVEDNDVLPFTSIEPIEYMILYAWKMSSSEVDAARKYKEEAAAWLKAQEITDNTVQTSIVHNVSVVGSMGELSFEADNI